MATKKSPAKPESGKKARQDTKAEKPPQKKKSGGRRRDLDSSSDPPIGVTLVLDFSALTLDERNSKMAQVQSFIDAMAATVVAVGKIPNPPH
jgi:hypothetical protein